MLTTVMIRLSLHYHQQQQLLKNNNNNVNGTRLVEKKESSNSYEYVLAVSLIRGTARTDKCCTFACTNIAL